MLVLAASILTLTLFCQHLLASATAGEVARVGPAALWIASSCFTLAGLAVVVLQSARVAQRVAGPEYRLVQSLRRIRTGDLAFRIHLRRGDLLTDLARECNELLEWLNTRMEEDVSKGSDIVEVESFTDGLDAEFAEVR